MTKRRGFLSDWTSTFLGSIEHVGNALPHPATLFAILALGIVILSGLATAVGLEATHPGTGEIVQPVNLLTLQGFHRILTEMVGNFTGCRIGLQNVCWGLIPQTAILMVVYGV